MKDETLRRRIALVTGGTRGIGRAVAACLADRCGRVYLTGRDAAQARAVAADLSSRNVGRDVRGLPLDLADAKQVEDFIWTRVKRSTT